VFPLWSFPNGTRTGGGVSGPGLCGLSLKNGVGEDPQGPGSVKTPHGVARGPRPPYSPCAAARRHLAGGPAAPSRGAGRGVPGGGRRGPRRPPPHRHRLPCGRKRGGEGVSVPPGCGGGGVADSLPPENNPKTFQSRSENSVSPLPALMEKGVVGWVMKFVWHGIGMASPPSGPKERRGDRAAGPGEGPRSGPRPAPLLWGNRQ